MPSNKQPEKTYEREKQKLKELLKFGYEQHTKLRSILFKDHVIPIQGVHFTIDERNEKDDETRFKAEAEQLAQEEKEAEKRGYIVKDPKTRNAWERLLKEQSGGEGVK